MGSVCWNTARSSVRGIQRVGAVNVQQPNGVTKRNSATCRLVDGRSLIVSGAMKDTSSSCLICETVGVETGGSRYSPIHVAKLRELNKLLPRVAKSRASTH